MAEDLPSEPNFDYGFTYFMQSAIAKEPAPSHTISNGQNLSGPLNIHTHTGASTFDPSTEVFQSFQNSWLASNHGLNVRDNMQTDFSCLTGGNGMEGGVQVNNMSMPESTDGINKPKILKRKWTGEEDGMLKKLIERYGPGKWKYFGELVGGRTGKQCRERWINHLMPTIKKGRWTDQEDMALIIAHSKFKNNWVKIAKSIPGRTPDYVKNHWNTTLRRSSNLPRSSTILMNYMKYLAQQKTSTEAVAIVAASREDLQNIMDIENIKTTLEEEDSSDISVSEAYLSRVKNALSTTEDTDRSQNEISTMTDTNSNKSICNAAADHFTVPSCYIPDELFDDNFLAGPDYFELPLDDNFPIPPKYPCDENYSFDLEDLDDLE